MPDLHGWISQKIDAVEQAARACPPWPWVFEPDDDAVVAADGIQVADVFALSGGQLRAAGAFIAANDPDATLRRCAADRKLLEIHNYHGGTYDVLACTGCGYDDRGYLVDHLNDCETLQALAAGYGITDDEFAQLDRPEPERQTLAGGKSALQVIDEFLWAAAETRRHATTTSAVPAALRGPNWNPRPTT
jgi:hypothetical protein